jgi:hypothetical protein
VWPGFGQHEEGLVDHGHQDAVDHKAGRVLLGDEALAQGLGQAFTASCVASLVCKRRMISTSAIMGTGLKKCMPMNLSARLVAAAAAAASLHSLASRIFHHQLLFL